MNTIFRIIQQGKTHVATAQAIYDYLQAHPDELPNNQDIEYLTFRLDDTEAAIQLSDFANSHLSAFPAVVTDTHINQTRSASWGSHIGNGVVFGRPSVTGNHPETREIAVSRIRVAIMRSLRYQNTQAAKREAQTA